MAMSKTVTRIPLLVDGKVFPAGTEVFGVRCGCGGERAVRFPNGAVASVKMLLELEEVIEPFDFNALLPLG